MSLTILIDMDDTIECLLVAWIDWLNREYGRNVTEDDVHEWNLASAYPGLTAEQVYAPLTDHNLWRNVKPKPGARYAIERMQNDGHEIYIVTSSNFRTIHTKLTEVLFRYFPTVDRDHVIVAQKKQMIRGDVLIDDGPHNLVGGEYLKIMPTAAHNRDFDAHANGVIRAETWEEIYQIVCDYSKYISAIRCSAKNWLTPDDAARLLGLSKDELTECVSRLYRELTGDTENE